MTETPYQQLRRQLDLLLSHYDATQVRELASRTQKDHIERPATHALRQFWLALTTETEDVLPYLETVGSALAALGVATEAFSLLAFDGQNLSSTFNEARRLACADLALSKLLEAVELWDKVIYHPPSFFSADPPMQRKLHQLCFLVRAWLLLQAANVAAQQAGVCSRDDLVEDA